mmetsp:Transcript_5391/g.7421  ORF Transcript_5391/g.7421 Transcript_5391/m.7421 type:complete len:111 (+) Transcript_5391:1232-1564(+)
MDLLATLWFSFWDLLLVWLLQRQIRKLGKITKKLMQLHPLCSKKYLSANKRKLSMKQLISRNSALMPKKKEKKKKKNNFIILCNILQYETVIKQDYYTWINDLFGMFAIV